MCGLVDDVEVRFGGYIFGEFREGQKEVLGEMLIPCLLCRVVGVD